MDYEEQQDHFRVQEVLDLVKALGPVVPITISRHLGISILDAAFLLSALFHDGQLHGRYPATYWVESIDKGSDDGES